MPLSFNDIKLRFEQERRTRRIPVGIEDLPFTYEDITPPWLTAVLARATPDARVLGFELGPVDNGTSNRRRIAVDWNEAGRAAGLADRLFCKGTQSLESRYMLGMNEGVQAEVNFYNLVRPHLELHAPVALFARYDPHTLNSIIMMRDMQHEVAFCQLETDLELMHAQSQMRLFATLHSRYYQSPALDTTLAPFSLWEDFFTITCVDAGFTDACLRGFRLAEAVIPGSLFQREAEVWPATLRCTELHRTLPRGLKHSDVHLKRRGVPARRRARARCRDDVPALSPTDVRRARVVDGHAGPAARRTGNAAGRHLAGIHQTHGDGARRPRLSRLRVARRRLPQAAARRAADGCCEPATAARCSSA